MGWIEAAEPRSFAFSVSACNWIYPSEDSLGLTEDSGQGVKMMILLIVDMKGDAP
jgi:hypothetical protein